MPVRLLCRLTVCFFLLFTSCGLETFYEINPPENAVPQNPADGTTVNTQTSTAETRKFEFSSVLNTGFIASGTEVYYRIYNSQETLQKDAAQINAVNKDNSADGFYKMQSLNYRRIRTSSGSDMLIDGSHRVVIRLVNEGAAFPYTYSLGVFYDGIPTAVPSFNPRRYGDKDFHFGNTAAQLPKSGDGDFEFSSVSGEYWFVNAYAVSVGLNPTTWARSVSKVLPLGFLAFRKE